MTGRMTHVQANISFANPDEARAFINGLIASQPQIAVKMESYPVMALDAVPDSPSNAAPVAVALGSTGADPASDEAPTASEPEAKALTLPQQKKAKEAFNKFLKANDVATASALLAKYGVRRWSELTPEQMSLVATELASK